jgi:hypothetical protein
MPAFLFRHNGVYSHRHDLQGCKRVPHAVRTCATREISLPELAGSRGTRPELELEFADVMLPADSTSNGDILFWAPAERGPMLLIQSHMTPAEVRNALRSVFLWFYPH